MQSSSPIFFYSWLISFVYRSISCLAIPSSLFPVLIGESDLGKNPAKTHPLRYWAASWHSSLRLRETISPSSSPHCCFSRVFNLTHSITRPMKIGSWLIPSVISSTQRWGTHPQEVLKKNSMLCVCLLLVCIYGSVCCQTYFPYAEVFPCGLGQGFCRFPLVVGPMTLHRSEWWPWLAEAWSCFSLPSALRPLFS